MKCSENLLREHDTFPECYPTGFWNLEDFLWVSWDSLEILVFIANRSVYIGYSFGYSFVGDTY